MAIFLYIIGTFILAAGLLVFAYLDRIYRELDGVTVGRIHANLAVFETEVEPRLGISRARANRSFSLLAHGWLVLIAVVTAHGIWLFALGSWRIALELIFFLGLEITLTMHFLPSMLLARTTGRWLAPLAPLVRLLAFLVWPVHALLDFGVSVLHLSEDGEGEQELPEQQAIEALVEAAKEEGILEHDEARLIEQVVEFSDKRVREVMTPRPEVVAIPGEATLEQLRRLLIETKFSRLPVYQKSLDDVTGIAYARDILQVPEREAGLRLVSELARPALFVPETKFGSELLKEMQRKSQQMAIVIDEYGSTAGVVTVEDLVEEIVGEIGEEDRAPVPDIVRESGGSIVLRGSVSLEKVKELFSVALDEAEREAGAATIAGLLNSIAGHVPVQGEAIEYDGLHFEVLEANQRKVLRLRVRRADVKTAASETA